MKHVRRRFSRRPLLTCAVLGLTTAVLSGQEKESFADFLSAVSVEARARGISQATLDSALTDIEPEPVVVARDRAQPEQVQSLDSYVTRRVTAGTIKKARTMLTTHRRVLTTVDRAYGVPPHVLIAIWGIESNFGQFTGTYQIIRSLATLAHDARRPIFRDELFHALTIVDRGMATAEDLKGSWAGAMGQPQFMPSSFLTKAVDFDGDGRINIWTSSPDVFGSMGNYLKQAGWTGEERWGREVHVSPDVLARIERDVPMRTGNCRALREMSTPQPLARWNDLGVTLTKDRPLPSATLDASLVRGERRFFLVYRSYEALIDYNCSNSYAIAVGLLSDAVVGAW